jgi:pimeloyl-ACP methyl ester carboxylesterase
MRQQVYELHALLEKAAVKPPYVMVGHSYGGWLVRTFTSTYPMEVAGMVLVEAGADDPVRVLEDGVPRHASDLVTGRPIPPAKTSDPLRKADIPPAAYTQMQAAAARFGPRANEPPRDKLPADARRMRTWAYSQIKHWTQANNPFEPEELALLRAERAKSAQPYGDMPLFVLTRGLSEEGGPDSKEFLAEHRKEHEAIARLSDNGQLIVAAHSGHHVQIDEPQLVVTTIQTVVAAGRKP